MLDTEEKEILENIMPAWSELNCISSEERFTEGSVLVYLINAVPINWYFMTIHFKAIHFK